MKAVWKGTISFGLVNIPVGVVPAIRAGQRIHLTMLRKDDLSRIRYRRIAEADGHEVAADQVVKGYEYEKDRFVVVTQEDLNRVRIASTRSVHIREFVNESEIDPQYYDQPYYLVPDQAGVKAYTLLLEALRLSGKVGLAKVVLRPPREHLAVVRPVKEALSLELLHFADELHPTSELPVPNAAVSSRELQMAGALIKSMTGQWKPDAYRDEYREGLLEVIRQKAQDQSIGAAEPSPSDREEVGASDLATMLEQSIAKASNGTGDRAQEEPPPKQHPEAA